MCRLTDGPLFAVLSYLSWGREEEEVGGVWGDMFGVAVALLPVAEQRPVQLQVKPWTLPSNASAMLRVAAWNHRPHKLKRRCLLLSVVAVNTDPAPASLQEWAVLSPKTGRCSPESVLHGPASMRAVMYWGQVTSPQVSLAVVGNRVLSDAWAFFSPAGGGWWQPHLNPKILTFMIFAQYYLRLWMNGRTEHEECRRSDCVIYTVQSHRILGKILGLGSNRHHVICS